MIRCQVRQEFFLGRMKHRAEGLGNDLFGQRHLWPCAVWLGDDCMVRADECSGQRRGCLDQRRMLLRRDVFPRRHIGFLIESLNNPMMEGAGMAGNGRSRLPGVVA